MTSGPWVPATIALCSVLLAGAGGLLLLQDLAGAVRLRPDDQGSAGAGERAVRSLGRPVARLLLPRWLLYRTVVDRWLAYSGRSRSTDVDGFAEQHLGLTMLCGCVALVSLGTGARWFALAAVTIAAAVPPLQLFRAARARQQVIEQAMPAFLELMAVLLASGLTFRHALARVSARIHGPLAEETTLLLSQLEFGWTPRDALDALVARSDAPTVRRLVASARMNAELGVPIAETLSVMADEVRADMLIELRVRAREAADRAAVALVFLVLPGVLGITMAILVTQALGTFTSFSR